MLSILWIGLSIFIFFIVVETGISIWLNAGTTKRSKKSKPLLKNIQERFVKRKVS